MPHPDGLQAVFEKSFSAGTGGLSYGPLKRLPYILLACLALLMALPLPAAEVAPVMDVPVTIDSWTTGDGLPQNSVIAIAQTHDGYLWLGTLNGLVRFDGNEFTCFNVNTTPGLPSDRIVFLFEDSRGVLWVGTDNAGLCSIQNGVVKSYSLDGTGNITYAYDDNQGGVWFCTAANRLFYWKDGQLNTNLHVPNEFWEQLLQRAYHVVIPGQGQIFWHLDGKDIQKWDNGLLERDYGPYPWRGANSSVNAQTVTAACVDQDGNLLVGVRSAGVYWFGADGGERLLVSAEDLAHKNVYSLSVDRDNNLWVGTDGSGLFRVKRNYFEVPAGLSAGVMQSVTEDAEGGLWVQDNTRGVIYFRTNSVRDYGFGAWSLLADQKQNVWAGTRGQGLFRLDAEQLQSASETNDQKTPQFKPVTETSGLGGRIYALFEGHDGDLWVGGDNGLGQFDGQNWKLYTLADGLPAAAVRAIAESTNGDIWIGTQQGLFELSAGKILNMGSPVSDISCLLVDHGGGLWIGTSGHGLVRYDGAHWTQYSASDGLAGDDVGYLIEDDLGNLWIGSYEGLARADEKSLAAAATDKSRQISCRVFLTRECSAGAQPAAIRARDGKFWFPTIQGLVSVNPSDLKIDTNPPPVIIESVQVDGVSQQQNPLSSAWTGAVTLSPKNRQLDIRFTALDFTAPKYAQRAVRFKYKLEGRDKAFTDIGGERAVHFNKLSPGDYVFQVIACNEDGVWNETGAQLQIVVQPPFWRKPSFLAASTLLFLGVLAGIIYLVSTAKLKREVRTLHQKELIEKERARIARDLHDQLGANLTQVALLGEMAEADKDLPAEVEQHAQQICATARDTTRSLDEIVWAVNPSNDTLEGLANYACKYAQDYFALANISFRAELPPNLPALPILPEVRHNVFLAFKEAVNNVVKHAQATQARVWLRLEPGQFILGVDDNGRGLGDVSEKKLRNGLKNMRKRLTDVHGQFEIGPGATGGTAVQLIVPVTPTKP